ncbi:MAG TPA: hypothetical protein VMI52_08735 [Acetobacteraceae bacterium]|nr:hypothetical protein [Acetobacteraceae bacterium]
MAEPTPVPAAGPVTAEAFIADRQQFWMAFIHLAGYGVAGVVVLLILLAVFLV